MCYHFEGGDERHIWADASLLPSEPDGCTRGIFPVVWMLEPADTSTASPRTGHFFKSEMIFSWFLTMASSFF